jgi:hypothetical protein
MYTDDHYSIIIGQKVIYHHVDFETHIITLRYYKYNDSMLFTIGLYLIGAFKYICFMIFGLSSQWTRLRPKASNHFPPIWHFAIWPTKWINPIINKPRILVGDMLFALQYMTGMGITIPLTYWKCWFHYWSYHNS